MKEYKASWYNITLEDKIGIDNVIASQLSDNDKVKSYVYIIYGEDINDIPMGKLDEVISSLSFLGKEIPVEKIKKKYTINGHNYIFTKDINKITSGQYLDYQTFIGQKPVEYNKLLSSLLIPEGHKYGDGYDFEEVFEDLLKINVVDLNTISNFLMGLSVKCIKSSAASSMLKIWKMKEMTLKEKIKATDLIYRTVNMNLTVSSTTL